MKILVSGSLGHIGSALVPELCKNGQEVIMIDNLLTQRFASSFNLPYKHQFYDFDISDVGNKPFLEKVMKTVDAVIHLAARTDAAGSANDPVEVERNNFQSTKILCELCAQLDKPITHISSTSVYGTQSETVDENCGYEQLQPQSPYAHSKLKEEKLIARLCQDGLRYNVLRFGTIYGYSIGMRFHTAVNKFAWQAAHNEEITVWRTALHQVRPYLYLGDAVKSLRMLVESNTYTNDVTNILTDNLTVNRIIEELKKYYPNLGIRFVDSPIMNQLSYNVCNQKSKGLGVKYTGSIEMGIKEIVDVFQNLKNEF